MTTPETTDHGTLHNLRTGEAIRPATEQEQRDSIAAVIVEQPFRAKFAVELGGQRRRCRFLLAFGDLDGEFLECWMFQDCLHPRFDTLVDLTRQDFERVQLLLEFRMLRTLPHVGPLAPFTQTDLDGWIAMAAAGRPTPAAAG